MSSKTYDVVTEQDSNQSPEESVSASNSKTEAPKKTDQRALNDVRGEALEKAVVAVINGEDFDIDPALAKDKEAILADAVILAKELRAKYGDDVRVSGIGNAVTKERGDLLINDSIHVELKYINGKGSGTYHNTSMYNLTQYGVKPLNEFYNEHGYYDEVSELLEKEGIDFRPDPGRNSPFTQAQGKVIRGNKELYKKIQAVEERCRLAYVSEEIAPKVFEDQEALGSFVRSIAHKDTHLEDSVKDIPDEIIAVDRKNHTVSTIGSEEVKRLFAPSENGEYTFDMKNKGVTVNGTFRIAFGWQNGTGLNNPTIRAFLMKPKAEPRDTDNS